MGFFGFLGNGLGKLNFFLGIWVRNGLGRPELLGYWVQVWVGQTNHFGLLGLGMGMGSFTQTRPNLMGFLGRIVCVQYT